MEIKKNIPNNTITRKLVDLDKETGNIYESVNIIARRANQIATELKTELNRKLADFSARNIVSVLVHYANLPAITGFSDCSDLMYVVHTQVNTSRSDRLGQTIVCIIFMIGKVFFPTLNKARRNGLCADMHKPPLRKRIILEVYVTSVDCVQYILCPRNQKPYNRAFFF